MVSNGDYFDNVAGDAVDETERGTIEGYSVGQLRHMLPALRSLLDSSDPSFEVPAE
jgi:hypothetical protein